MKLLRWRERFGDGAIDALLFGSGLIGGAIDRALARRVAPAAARLDWSWTDPQARAAQAEALATRIAAAPPARICVVWAAGRGGFGSSAEEMRAEAALVEEIFALCDRLRAAAPEAALDLHLFSSAGGLYEGRTQIRPGDAPAPQRPYGEGKLAQEEAARRWDGADRLRIHRPSSVYGYWPGGRLGLISALAGNAISGRTTRIVGGMSTIRDFVLAEDIGDYIAADMRTPSAPRHATTLLANGRPTSMFEAIRQVEARLGTPLNLQFDARPSNAANMSFMPSALPTDWRTTPLSLGVDLVVTRMRRALLERT